MGDHFKKLQLAIIRGHASQSNTCVGIQGMGKTRKTLLVQLMNNDEEIHKVFGEESICWITMGHNGSVSSIYGQMKNYLQACTSSDGLFLEDQRTSLMNVFSSQGILLKVDNVWDNLY